MIRNPVRILLISVAVLAGMLGSLITLAPPGLYALGLNNVNGRPSPPASCHPTPADRALLERTFRMAQPMTVKPLSPWAYLNFILEDDAWNPAAGGVEAASFVAQHYNTQHLKDRRAIAWHLSGAALTIWITRHWSGDQVLCAAVDVLRQTPSSRPTRSAPTDIRRDGTGSNSPTPRTLSSNTEPRRPKLRTDSAFQPLGQTPTLGRAAPDADRRFLGRR